MAGFHPFLPLDEWQLSTHSGHYDLAPVAGKVKTPTFFDGPPAGEQPGVKHAARGKMRPRRQNAFRYFSFPARPRLSTP